MGPQRVRHEWQTLTSLHFFSLPWSCHSASPYQTFGCLLSCNLGGNLESNPEGSFRSSNICNYCPVFYKKKNQSFDLGIITIIYTLHKHLKIPLLGLPWWLSGPRIRLPMQETLAWSLNQEDPPCHGATKHTHHNYWVCALQPEEPQLLSAWAPDLAPRNGRSHLQREAQRLQWRVAPVYWN